MGIQHAVKFQLPIIAVTGRDELLQPVYIVSMRISSHDNRYHGGPLRRLLTSSAKPFLITRHHQHHHHHHHQFPLKHGCRKGL